MSKALSVLTRPIDGVLIAILALILVYGVWGVLVQRQRRDS